MASANNFLYIAQEVDKIIDYIENSNKKASDIIKDLEDNFNYSRKVLDNRFKAIYIPKDGYKETLSAYIKRRQSTNDDYEEKYDMENILYAAAAMKILEDYEFCKVNIDKYKLHKYYNSDDFYKNIMSEINHKKMFYATLCGDIYIYPILSTNTYDFGDMINFNMDYVHEEQYSDYNYSKKWIEFDEFYFNKKNAIALEINDLIYFISSRKYIKDDIDRYIEINIPDDLSKYKTILYKTKDVLRAIIDSNMINEGEVKLNIKTQQDINDHYEESVEVLLKTMDYNEIIVFERIRWIEEGKIKNMTLYDIHLPKFLRGESSSYQICRATLYSLFIKGYIYLDK